MKNFDFCKNMKTKLSLCMHCPKHPFLSPTYCSQAIRGVVGVKALALVVEVGRERLLLVQLHSFLLLPQNCFALLCIKYVKYVDYVKYEKYEWSLRWRLLLVQPHYFLLLPKNCFALFCFGLYKVCKVCRLCKV